MGMEAVDSSITFDGVVSEDVIKPLREYLQKCAPLKLTVDLSECRDMHTAVIQMVAAYHLLYGCEYVVGTKGDLPFVTALLRARFCEHHNNQ